MENKPARRRYEAPTLKQHGEFKKLTKDGITGSGDETGIFVGTPPTHS